MLKIKDNVDLKELEKFGFEYLDNYGDYINNKIYIQGDTRIIAHCDCEDYNEDLDALYDLIKADLIEKVGE